MEEKPHEEAEDKQSETEIEEAEETKETRVEEETEEVSEGEKVEEIQEEEKKAPEVEAEEGEIETEEKVPEREELEEEIVEERIYTVPLQRARIVPPNKRAPKAIRILRSFIERHMKIGARAKKTEEEEEEAGELVISNEVNEKIWGKGIEKPPRKIRVRAVRDKEGFVTVYLAEGD